MVAENISKIYEGEDYGQRESEEENKMKGGIREHSIYTCPKDEYRRVFCLEQNILVPTAEPVIYKTFSLVL